MSNIVLQHIENYGFQVEQLEHTTIESYKCTNQVSKAQFVLVCLNEELDLPDVHLILTKINHEEPLEIVYLIHIKDNVDQVIELVQDEENQNKTFLIYDEEDEIEFFLKDLWNIIIEISISK